MPFPGINIGSADRGGHGQNGDGTWRETDGRGCPVCGAINGGGHGGGCPNHERVFNEDGMDITANVRDAVLSLLRRLGEC